MNTNTTSVDTADTAVDAAVVPVVDVIAPVGVIAPVVDVIADSTEVSKKRVRRAPDAPVNADDVSAGFRLIVRGTNAKKQRVRRVRVMHGTIEQVVKLAGEVARKVIEDEKLEDPVFNVFPPSGIRLDGQLSKGHADVGGFVVKTNGVTA